MLGSGTMRRLIYSSALAVYRTKPPFYQDSDAAAAAAATRSENSDEQQKCGRVLLQAHQVPEIYRQSGIHSGYVAPGSLRGCLVSLFTPSNEMFNVWSHLLAVLYFSYWLMQFNSLLDLSLPQNWPLLAYLLSVCFYTLASCLAHALSPASTRAAQAFFFVDYAAVSLFSFGSALAYRAYGMSAVMRVSLYGQLYLPGALLVAALSTLFACRSRFLPNNATQTSVRCLSYLAPYLWANMPVLSRLSVCAPLHLRQTIFSALAGALYGSRLPERLAPGRFDVVGNSHNWLHVFGTLATHQQMWAVRCEMGQMRMEMEADEGVYLAAWASSGALLALLVNGLIVVVATIFSWQQLQREEALERTLQCRDKVNRVNQ